MATQVRFRDLEHNESHGGILLDDGCLICGCCGKMFMANEKGSTWDILTSFTWLNLDDEICGGM